VACDLSIDMLQQRKAIARTAAVVGAGEQLPFRDGTFDGMYSINVIEHVADVEAVVAEGARVLRPGGVLAAVTPNGNWERWLDLAGKLADEDPGRPAHLPSPPAPSAAKIGPASRSSSTGRSWPVRAALPPSAPPWTASRPGRPRVGLLSIRRARRRAS
jgi:SAM-dependent methyltransferase